MIKLQVKNKHCFKNKISIRYENLINSLESVIFQLENYFNIKGNLNSARECLTKPSSSSKFRYGYQEISSNKANANIKLARELWGYA